MNAAITAAKAAKTPAQRRADLAAEAEALRMRYVRAMVLLQQIVWSVDAGDKYNLNVDMHSARTLLTEHGMSLWPGKEGK